MKIAALLPMKANSERVRGKNFKELGGKPLFKWMLDTLTSVSEIDSIVINTDARDILLKNGVTEDNRLIIRDRRLEICGDLVSMNIIIEDDLNNIDADIYLMTHTTNPFLKKESIQRALKKFKKALKNNDADSLFTVNKVQERFYDSDSKPINHDPSNLVRTQDLNPWFLENSNLYIFTSKSFNSTKARIGLNPIMYETDDLESIDIDTSDDWELAKLIAEHKMMQEETI